MLIRKRNTIPVTALLMLKKGNEILLMRRYNTGYQDGKYCFPGGHVEKGEEVKMAAIREAKEEIGISIEEENLILSQVFNIKVEDNAYIYFIFECKNWEGVPSIMEKDKADELKWFNLKEIPENVIPFMKEAFEKENQIYVSYGWEE